MKRKTGDQKKISLKEKNLKIKTKNIVEMTEALTQTNKRTHKKMKIVKTSWINQSFIFNFKNIVKVHSTKTTPYKSPIFIFFEPYI